MPPPKKTPEIENLTIGELISNLKPAQLWAIILAFSAIIGLTYSFGVAIGKDKKATAVADRQLLRDKYEFIERNLRYQLARDLYTKERVMGPPSSSLQEDSLNFERSRDIFVELIYKWWDDQQSFDGKIEMEPDKHIVKGDVPTDSRVRFRDESVWKIPSEIKEIVLEKESQKK